MAPQVALLSPPVNFAVVQLSERKFPGVVVQGDTLRSLKQQVEQMSEMLDSRRLDDLAGEIEDVKEQLSQALVFFEQVCRERNIGLPY
jgi:hypothetical protein